MNLVNEAMTAHWGRRCNEFEPRCPTCKAWAEYDKLCAAYKRGYAIGALDALAEAKETIAQAREHICDMIRMVEEGENQG